MIAGTIMAAIFLPLLGLLFGARGSQEEESMMGEASTLAANIMDRLISESVPFEAIDPSGGSALVPAIDGTFQAGFTAAYKAQLDALLQDATEADPNGGGDCRIRTKGLRNSYYIYFFAGKYPDDPAVVDAWENSREAGLNHTRADINNTLSFLYLPNPAKVDVPFSISDQDQQMSEQIVMNTPKTRTDAPAATVPYLLTPFVREKGLTEKLRALDANEKYFARSPKDESVIVGWPKLPPGLGRDIADVPQERANWSLAVRRVTSAGAAAAGPGQAPTVGYHPRLVGQSKFLITNGAYMKVIVGVKFAPHRYRSGNIKDAGVFREFWLVGFKAKLKDLT